MMRVIMRVVFRNAMLVMACVGCAAGHGEVRGTEEGARAGSAASVLPCEGDALARGHGSTIDESGFVFSEDPMTRADRDGCRFGSLPSDAGAPIAKATAP